MTIGEFLAQFAEYIYGFWPVRVVSEWQQGVYVRAGQVIECLDSTTGIRGTGIHWFCPMLSEIHVQEANIETVTTPKQAHETADQQSVAFNFAVRFAVVDLAAMFQTIHEPNATIINEIMSSAGGFISTFTYADAQAELCAAVEREISPRLEEWGIELQNIQLANFAKNSVVTLMGVELTAQDGKGN